MSDTVDLTRLSGSRQGIERDVRLLRLQFDQFAGAVPPRNGGMEGRLSAMEQSVHDLTAEVARGFGQMQQQLTRHEKRFDALDAALAALPERLTEHVERIVRAIMSAREP